MSLKRKFVSAITLAFACLTLTVFVSAQEKSTAPAPDTMGMLRGLHGVDLTEAQRTQIRGIMESKRDSFKQVHEQMRTLGRAKHEGTLTAEQETQFRTLKDQIKANADATRQEVLNILTAEQKTKLEQFQQEMKQRKAERRQQRGPRPGRGEGPPPPPADKPTDN
jgi:Spy/CpxP family protein refolding chaperone